MREIKFRAWDILSESWQPWRTPYQVERGASELFRLNEKDGTVYFNRGDVVIMQYIGLKDRHGKEIYEGDIVSGSHGNYKVSYEGGAYRLRTAEGTSPDYLPILENSDRIEVIGNIYENPELLEAKHE